MSGVRTAWVSSSGVAPSPPCLISSDAGSMSSAVFISESQLVVTLATTLLLEVAVAGIVIAGVAVTGIAVARIALVVSTVTATVTSSSQEIFQTKEPDTNFILSWSLAFPPPAAVTAVVAPKQSEQTSVGFLTVSLSFPATIFLSSTRLFLIIIHHLLPQGLDGLLKLLLKLLLPPLRAPPRTAPPRSPAPTPRIPPSISSLPVLINLVSVEGSSLSELLGLLVLALLLPELLLEEDPPPNFSCA